MHQKPCTISLHPRKVKDTTWLSQPDLIRKYTLSLSLDVQDEVNRAKKRAEEMEELKARTPIIFRYTRTKDQIENHEPSIEVPLPPYHRRLAKVEDGHLYISPIAKIGSGNHSVVYKAEWELPRDLLMEPRFCEVSMKERTLEEIQRLKDSGRWDKLLRAAGWGPKGLTGPPRTQAEIDKEGAGDPPILEKDGEVIEREITCIVSPDLSASDILQFLDRNKIWNQIKEKSDEYRFKAADPGTSTSAGAFHSSLTIEFKRVNEEEAPTNADSIVLRVNPPLTYQNPSRPETLCAPHLPQLSDILREKRRTIRSSPSTFSRTIMVNIVPPVHDPVPVHALVPQFDGYYTPGPGSEVPTELRDDGDDDDGDDGAGDGVTKTRLTTVIESFSQTATLNGSVPACFYCDFWTDSCTLSHFFVTWYWSVLQVNYLSLLCFILQRPRPLNSSHIPITRHGGYSSSCYYFSDCRNWLCVIKALVNYGASVKNANKLCERMVQQIRMINSLARAAEAYARELSSEVVPEAFGKLWINPNNPATSMLYMTQLKDLQEKLDSRQRLRRAAIESLEPYIVQLNCAVTLHNADLSNAILRQGEQQFQDARCSDELEKIYVWMDAVNCTTKHETTLTERQDQTCKWLLDSNQYSDWYASQNSFFWLRGKPGAGKSVLVSVVIENLLNTNGSVPAYVYCDFRTERSTHASSNDGNQSCLLSFDDLVKRKSNLEPPPADLEQLFQFLLRALRLHDSPILIIDALDECNDYVKLTELLARLPEEGSCRVFTTSRVLPHAPRTFHNIPTIDLHDTSAETQRDMELHVEKEIAKCETLAHLRGEIVPSLLEKAEGMILSDIDKKPFDGRIVKSVLPWLVSDLKPLSLGALAEAVTFDIQDEFLPDADVLGVCRGLASHNETGDVVSLSHFSVKEYLYEHLNMSALSHYYLSSPIAENHLARICIDYFRTPQMMPKFQNCLVPRRNSGLSEVVTTLEGYVEVFGSQHFHRAVETEEPLDALMQSMLKLDNALRSNLKGSDIVLNFIVSFGTPYFLKTYLQHSQPATRMADIPDGKSPLVYAITHVNYACVESLLNLGLDIKLRCPNFCYQSIYTEESIHPLQAAVAAGDSRIIGLLLDRHCVIPQGLRLPNYPQETTPV
ncbi:hypothetical protein BU15DRAFT_80237 [Melanogaster broomeanus]|nr:hypothetical protein BU15DRAFT_80237 [Melanogaster broomeanus]